MDLDSMAILLGSHWQFSGQNSALRFETLWQMGIGVQGNTVRTQLIHLLQSAVKRFRRLLGQTINQIDIDRLKSHLAGSSHQRKNLGCRLDSVYCFLHLGVKILNAKAQAVKA